MPDPAGGSLADKGLTDREPAKGCGPGENPIFTDHFTADPAALVVGDTVYVYVGHDDAKVGEFFNMSQWFCYSSQDMKNWNAAGHCDAAGGVFLRAGGHRLGRSGDREGN